MNVFNFLSNLSIIYLRKKIIKNFFIMKKLEFASTSLKFKKVSIANLMILGGADTDVSEDSSCCSEPPICLKTLTTRPDSLEAHSADVDAG